MGVSQLATFMKESLPNGTREVSIKVECQKFEERTGKRPTLVFDILPIFALFHANKVWTLCGGRHQVFRKELETFMENLSQFANLVFFEDGPSVKVKEVTRNHRRKDRHDLEIEVLKHIDEGKALREITKFPRIKPSLSFLKKHGKHFTTVTKECDTELARYASNDPSVLAVLTDDTDFLIFPGSWRYFSIENINLNDSDLTTIEYSRSELRKYLELDDKQMIILSTLAGNDIVSPFHKKKRILWKNKKKKFPVLAKHIRSLPIDEFGQLCMIAKDVFGDERPESIDRIKESFEQYNIKFDIVDYSSNPLLNYCLENNLKTCLTIQ